MKARGARELYRRNRIENGGVSGKAGTWSRRRVKLKLFL